MTKREFNEALGLLDPSLVEEYVGLKEKLAKRKHRRTLRLRCSLVAACLCTVIAGLVIAIPMLYRDEPERINTDNFVILSEYTDIDQDSSSECPKGPFDGLIGYRVLTEKLGYGPDEAITLVLSYGLTREPRYKGVVKATLDTGAFSSTAPKEITVGRLNFAKHGGYDALKLRIPLTPPKEASYGEIVIEFRFYPDDPEALRLYSLDENGSLLLTHIEVPYVTNKFETAFSSSYGISGRELFIERLPILCESGKITKKQFADIYYSMRFSDTVIVDILQKSIHSNSFRFCYYSKNIRYESSEHTDDYELLASRFQARRFAVDALDYMKKNGVITEDEYRSELLWLNEVASISEDGTSDENYINGNGISGYESETMEMLKKHRLSHFDK